MKKSCKKDYVVACYRLGIMYRDANGTGRSIRKAKEKLLMASILGAPNAEKEYLSLLAKIEKQKIQ